MSRTKVESFSGIMEKYYLDDDWIDGGGYFADLFCKEKKEYLLDWLRDLESMNEGKKIKITFKVDIID